MSRIGKLPIQITQWVQIDIQWQEVKVKWPKGELSYICPEWVKVEKTQDQVIVNITDSQYVNLWGLVRTLISNMVGWVVNWYEKKLLVFGVWYNAKVQGRKLVMNLWYSHPINYDIPQGINITSEKDPKWSDILTITGVDKQLVWQVAAKIKTFREVEVYKGKGIRYFGEYIKLKPGKTAKK